MSTLVKTPETKEKPAIRIFVATPTYGGMAMTQYMASLLRLSEQSAASGIHISFMFVVNESLITRARNTLCHSFMVPTFCSSTPTSASRRRTSSP
jgi:hypothetical protein